MSPRPIEVVRGSDAQRVPALLDPELSAVEFAMAEAPWTEERTRIRRGLIERKALPSEWPESLHWDWTAKSPLLRRLEVRGTGIVVDGEWQGLMLTKSASYLTGMGADRGKPILYIDYVEGAPWNWAVPALELRPRFRGLGSVLVAEAVRQSFVEGFHRRIGLHSLPQSEGFYEIGVRQSRAGYLRRKSTSGKSLSFEKRSRALRRSTRGRPEGASPFHQLRNSLGVT